MPETQHGKADTAVVTPCPTDGLDQVAYFRQARVAPLLNNMVRQLLLELPTTDADIYDCLIRYLSVLEDELARGTKLGQLKRTALAELPKRRKLYVPPADAPADESADASRGADAEQKNPQVMPEVAGEKHDAADRAPPPSTGPDASDNAKPSTGPLDRDAAATRIQALARGRRGRSAARDAVARRALADLVSEEEAARQELECEWEEDTPAFPDGSTA
uniref:Uncharacterized protein n=1 Tax=Neobodo designis TaxID=312471 RepID=A0A7S1Q942_NEODS|mmetsp:Transcript_35864/g.110496  ORF Transcript_35864/g.110496 Transcript_35864/m.110496 type:complete len:219 (+) Transcript_35864:93-749(+)